jgi:uncharacterized damage-inducible protein DinB
VKLQLTLSIKIDFPEDDNHVDKEWDDLLDPAVVTAIEPVTTQDEREEQNLEKKRKLSEEQSEATTEGTQAEVEEDEQELLGRPRKKARLSNLG